MTNVIDKIKRLDATINDFSYLIEKEKDLELKEMLKGACFLLTDYKIDLMLSKQDIIKKYKEKPEPPIDWKHIERLMEKIVFDSVIWCYSCGHSPLEVDYDVCISCGHKNILKTLGLV